jgi:hypothetical protein
MAYQQPDHFTLFTICLNKERPSFLTEEGWNEYHNKAEAERAKYLEAVRNRMKTFPSENEREAFRREGVDFNYVPESRGAYEDYATQFFSITGIKTLLDRLL